VFSFLTTDASHDVASIHSDATPICLFTEDEHEIGMNAPIDLALTLQRPSARGALKGVATAKKEDGI
jgi:putative SOS response-associated peptidase YedK